MSRRSHTDPAPIPRPWETARDPRPPAGKPNHPRRRPRAAHSRPQTPQGWDHPRSPVQIHSTGHRSHPAPLNHHHQEVPR